MTRQLTLELHEGPSYRELLELAERTAGMWSGDWPEVRDDAKELLAVAELGDQTAAKISASPRASTAGLWFSSGPQESPRAVGAAGGLADNPTERTVST